MKIFGFVNNLKGPKKSKVIIGVIGVLSILAPITALTFYEEQFLNYYKEIRSDLFNSAFVLASFLLAMKTYIIVKMKEEVYDHDEYITDFVIKKVSGKIGNDTILGPLQRLASQISAAIYALSGAAFIQLLNGTIPGPVEPLLGFSSMGIAVAFALVCWIEMKRNLDHYFKFAEKKLEREIKTKVKALEEGRREQGLDENCDT